MFAQESVMDVQKMPTLAEKQEFWAEQLPNFKAKYWLPSHFKFVAFDMEQGNFDIKDGLDPSFEDDAVEIWHRVNTGWAMWKKAINFGRKQPQAVPEGFVLVPKEPTDKTIAHMINTPIEVNLLCDHADTFLSEGEAYIAYKAMIEAQEPTND